MSGSNESRENGYYPFGMMMPGRSYTGTTQYRYGFNGKEMDNETYGQGNEYDYGFRIYSPRIGRFFSVDPKAHKLPSWSPYAAFACN
ncbi:MAG TPA: RHS repeat-associated core domain-containing protein, partial [Chitinophagaceae bacterium]